MSTKQNLHLAKTIITNNGEPIINGALLTNESKIICIGKKEDFGNLEDKDSEIINHGDSLICPGFINLHTHLLYSNLNRLDGKSGLFPWLEDVVEKISSWTEKDYIKSIQHGINQALSTGTTFIVENTPSPLSIQELSNSPLRALVGLEVFGSDEEKANEIFNERLKKVEILSSNKIEFTFSPHAPYDVSIPLWKKLVNWSIKNNKPLLTHIEESPQEQFWWNEKTGHAINFWKKINKLDSKLKYWKKYESGIDFLNKNKLLNKNIIATHLCQAKEKDLNILKENKISLVHCPRSNFYLNNGTANLKLWSELGFLWGLGTDSSASNESLDLLEELRFTLKEQEIVYKNKIGSKEAFNLITLNAAKVLGKENEIGFLKKGHQADFLVYSLTDKPAYTYSNPYDLLVNNIDNKKDLKEVWINGKKAFIAEHLLHKI